MNKYAILKPSKQYCKVFSKYGIPSVQGLDSRCCYKNLKIYHSSGTQINISSSA
jgi:hypothetical protein